MLCGAVFLSLSWSTVLLTTSEHMSQAHQVFGVLVRHDDVLVLSRCPAGAAARSRAHEALRGDELVVGARR